MPLSRAFPVVVLCPPHSESPLAHTAAYLSAALLAKISAVTRLTVVPVCTGSTFTCDEATVSQFCSALNESALPLSADILHHFSVSHTTASQAESLLSSTEHVVLEAHRGSIHAQPQAASATIDSSKKWVVVVTDAPNGPKEEHHHYGLVVELRVGSARSAVFDAAAAHLRIECTSPGDMISHLAQLNAALSQCRTEREVIDTLQSVFGGRSVSLDEVPPDVPRPPEQPVERAEEPPDPARSLGAPEREPAQEGANKKSEVERPLAGRSWVEWIANAATAMTVAAVLASYSRFWKGLSR